MQLALLIARCFAVCPVDASMGITEAHLCALSPPWVADYCEAGGWDACARSCDDCIRPRARRGVGGMTGLSVVAVERSSGALVGFCLCEDEYSSQQVGCVGAWCPL